MIAMCQRPKQASFISTCNGADLLLFKQGLRDNRFFINALNGPFHSTCNGADLLLLKQGVSIPWTSFFISTVPAENVHKYWLYKLIFAGIYLNILIVRVFVLLSAFTCMNEFQQIFIYKSIPCLYMVTRLPDLISLYNNILSESEAGIFPDMHFFSCQQCQKDSFA